LASSLKAGTRVMTRRTSIGAHADWFSGVCTESRLVKQQLPQGDLFGGQRIQRILRDRSEVIGGRLLKDPESPLPVFGQSHRQITVQILDWTDTRFTGRAASHQQKRQRP
jgi:hypothetical protein